MCAKSLLKQPSYTVDIVVKERFVGYRIRVFGTTLIPDEFCEDVVGTIHTSVVDDAAATTSNSSLIE